MLTPLALYNSPQVTSGENSPIGTAPQDPNIVNIYYQIDGNGETLGVFVWSLGNQEWKPQPIAGGSNWSEGLVAGWEGPHNAAHLAPVHCEVASPCSLTPRFSVASLCPTEFTFEINDTTSGIPVMVAQGTFPASAKYANAIDCGLRDAADNPIIGFQFTPTAEMPVVHYTVTPMGGHSAMPAEGETFMAHFSQVY